MYSTYYKLGADPFRLSPDPRFCFPHRTYRKAMTYMRHALLRAEGFIIITGQPGMGKTTLINDLFRGIKPDQIRIARLVSTQLQADDLLRLVAFELGLDPAGMDKASVLNRVGQFLRQQHLEGRRTLLVVDEAQDVTGEALEELRLLTNIQIEGQQLLQIFLVGQEELRDTVSSPTLVQLHQRVIAAAHLEPLNATETKEYIKHRLQRVEWAGHPLISDQAYAMIHRFSRGIPRQINQICSRLLLHGSIEERDLLGLQDLKVVIEELHDEMLLPLGMQEIADTIVWPPDSQRENYDRRLRTRNGSQATAAGPRNDGVAATPPPAEHTGLQEPLQESAGGTQTAPAAGSQPDAGSVAETAAAGNAEISNRPEPATHGERPAGQRKNKPGPRRILAVIVLLAGLLLALLVAMFMQTEGGSGDSVVTPETGTTSEQHSGAGKPAPEPEPLQQSETAGTATRIAAETQHREATSGPVEDAAPAMHATPGPDADTFAMASRFDKTLSEAEGGNADSQYEVGNMFMSGIGADIDYGQAISFFEKSAGQGNSKAAYKLGLIYYEGTGVKTDKNTAFKWFSNAADKNHPAAQYYLGKLYAAGQGTDKDNKLALEWLTKSVDNGFDQARGELINVQEKMSMEAAAAKAKQKAEVERQAAAKAKAEREAQERAEARAREEERAKQQARAKEDSKKQQARAKEEAKKQQAKAKKEEPAEVSGVDIVMNGAWSRDNKPIPYLPSSLNTCRTEENQVICFSDDQTRESGGNIITFKTKSIVDNFDNKAKTFKVTYRNLVISAAPVTGTDLAAGDEEGAAGYQVKTGWGSPHTMDCSFKDNGSVSCLKNNTHAMLLVNTLSVASGGN